MLVRKSDHECYIPAAWQRKHGGIDTSGFMQQKINASFLTKTAFSLTSHSKISFTLYTCISLVKREGGGGVKCFDPQSLVPISSIFECK